MISKGSLRLGELFHGVEIKEPSNIIEGLNNVSTGVLDYTEDYASEIEETTSDNEHGLILDNLSTFLSNNITNSLKSIKEIGVGLSKVVAENLTYHLTTGPYNPSFTFIQTDNPFFKSSLFPTKVNDNSQSWTNVSFKDVLNGLSFTEPSVDEVKEFVASTNPEITELLSSCDLVPVTWWGTDFIQNWFGTKDQSFDATKVDLVRLDVPELLALYVLVARMYVTDEPVPWLKSGELSNYRQLVNMLYNGMTAMLIRIREVYKARSAMGMSLAYDPHNTAPHLNDMQWVEGNARVYVNQSVITTALNQGIDLNEVVTGYFIMKLSPSNGEPVALPSADTLYGYLSAYNERKEIVTNNLVNNTVKNIHPTLLGVAWEFLSGFEDVRERIMNRAQVGGVSPISIINNDLGEALRVICYKVYGDGGNSHKLIGEDSQDILINIILDSSLVEDLFLCLGDEFTAAIIGNTKITTEEDTLEDKKERLTTAVVDTIVSKCFV